MLPDFWNLDPAARSTPTHLTVPNLDLNLFHGILGVTLVCVGVDYYGEFSIRSRESTR